ncbi:MAG TPA: LamG-like jellyroll fold domain-containing protein [Puia sp.]|nr:LamG-like jellyroll fold domain-containing protein [Puia sp.]
MKFFTKPSLLLGILLSVMAVMPAFSQTGVLNPNDPVVIYNSAAPPATPPVNVLAKWVKTNRLSYNTNSYKCYYYNGYAFRLKFPKSYVPGVSDGKLYPVYVFWHGIGEKGTIYDNEYQLYHGGDVHMAAVDNGTFDGFLLYPQTSSNSGFFGTAAYDAIYSVIVNHLIPECKADPNRIITEGLSGGGTACWGFSMRYPKLISCLTPISAASQDFNDGIPNLKYTPIWQHQGGLDQGPTPATTSVIVNAYNAAGAQFRYKIYPTLGHGCWDSAWKEPDYYPYMLRAHKANPWTLFGRTEFCPGDAINVTIGITPGFNQYEWRKDGVLIPGATGNSIQATAPGVYDCHYRNGSYWSPWSPVPVTIKIKSPTVPPTITVSGLRSNVIPTPAGDTSVLIQVPANFATYAWQKVGSSTVLSTTNTLNATSPGSYQVQVMEQFGCSSNFSQPFTVVSSSGPNKPDPASGLKATTLSKTSVELDWSSNPNPAFNETAFEIYQATKAGGPYKLAAITAADASTYTLSNLHSGTAYYFIIRAVNNTGASANSNEANSTTQSDTQAPTPPTGLTITGTSATSVALSWTASTDDVAVTAYDIYINGIKSYISTSNTFTVFNLTHGRAYTFFVKARDFANNNSQPSNQVSGEPLAKGLSYKYYTYTGSWSAIGNLGAMVPVTTGIVPNVTLTGTPQATLFAYLWEGVITVPVTGTYTFRTNSDDGSRLWLGSIGQTASPYSFTTPSLVNNDGAHGSQNRDATITLTAGIYPIAIAYYQGTGGSGMTTSWKTPQTGNSFVKIPDSAFVEKFVANGPAPAAPSGVTATATSYNNINLSWTDNSNNETGFEIWRSLNGLTGFTSVATVPANTTTFSDSAALNASTTYYYRVRAIGQYGESKLVLNDNLTAKWLFNNNYNDSSANGIVLTPSNSPTFDAADKQEGTQSLVLNGSNQSATIANSALLQGGYNAMTIAFWMKSSNNTGNRIIADIGGSDNGLALRLDASRLYAGVASGNNRQNFNVAYTSTGWSHIALVYSGNTLRLYVNGVLAGSNTALPFSSVGATTNAMRIGTNNGSNAFNTGTGFFSGKLDNFSIYNTALSASDVTALMNNTYGFTMATTAALPAIPAAPSGMTASGVSPSKVLVTWADNSPNETKFELYRSTSTNANYVLLATLAPNTTMYSDSAVFANSIYYYRVRSASLGGFSAYAAEDSALTGDHAPVLTPITAQQYMRYDAQLSLPVTATDVDQETLTITVNNLPSFATFTPSGNGTGVITFTPSQALQGTYPGITVVVTDQHGGTTSSSFTLVVNDNYPPAIAHVAGGSNITVNEKQTAQLTLTATDQNATDALTWTITGLPAFATPTINGGTVQISIAPGYSDNGVYNVKARVDDGNNGFDTLSFVITVNDVNPSKTVYVNFTDGSIIAPAPWNNTSKVPALNDNFPALRDSTGATSSVGVKLTSLWTGINTGGVNTGNNSGVYPDAVLRTSYYTSTVQTVRIYGLDVKSKYNFTMTGSRANPAAGVGVVTSYTIGGVAQTLNAANNSTAVVSFNGIQPAADSSVTLTVQKATGSTYGYLNALVIQSVFDDSTAPAKPRGLAGTVANGTVVLNWTDAAYNETGYEVYRATSQGGPYTQLLAAGNNANLQAYSDSTVHGNTDYYYSVRAVNQYGATYSDTVLVTMPNVAPALVTVSNVNLKTDSVLDLSLTATDDPGNVITLTASGLPAFATFTDNGNGTGVIHLAPGSTTGTFTISVTATDNFGAATTKQFTVTVADKNLTFVYVNFNQTLQASAPWNNTNSAPTAGVKIANLADADGNSTGIGLSFSESWTAANNIGVVTGNNSGIYPDNVMQTFYYDGATTAKHVVLSGLSSARRYNLVFFASRANYTSSLITTYTVGSQTVQLDANNNSSQTVQVNGIAPDASGNITINVLKAGSSPNAYLGAMVIQSYVYNGTPTAPASLTAAGTTKTSIRLNWVKTSEGVDNYEVWRSSRYSGTYTKIGDAGTVNSYVDNNLVQGATWFYKVLSVTGGVSSPYSNVAGASTVAFTVDLNLNDGSAATPGQAAPWNNTNTLIDNGYTLNNMINDLSQPTGMNFGVVLGFSGYNTVGAVTGNNSGVVPDNVSKSLYYLNYGDSAILTLSNLDQRYVYNLGFFGSRANPVVGVTSNYRVGSQTVQQDATNNTSNIARIYSVRPDSTGTITFSVSAVIQGGFGYLNALIVDAVPRADTAADGSTIVVGQRSVTSSGRANTLAQDSASIISSARVYPNPFVDDVTLSLGLTESVEKLMVQVVDMSGKIVMRREFYNAPAGTWQQTLGLNGASLSKGIYLIQVVGIKNEKPRVFTVIKR